MTPRWAKEVSGLTSSCYEVDGKGPQDEAGNCHTSATTRLPLLDTEGFLKDCHGQVVQCSVKIRQPHSCHEDPRKPLAFFPGLAIPCPRPDLRWFCPWTRTARALSSTVRIARSVLACVRCCAAVAFVAHAKAPEQWAHGQALRA